MFYVLTDEICLWYYKSIKVKIVERLRYKTKKEVKKMVIDLYWIEDDLKEKVTHLIVDYERKEYCYYTNRGTQGMIRNSIQVKYKGDLTYYILMLELEGFNFVDYNKDNI